MEGLSNYLSNSNSLVFDPCVSKLFRHIISSNLRQSASLSPLPVRARHRVQRALCVVRPDGVGGEPSLAVLAGHHPLGARARAVGAESVKEEQEANWFRSYAVHARLTRVPSRKVFFYICSQKITEVKLLFLKISVFRFV